MYPLHANSLTPQFGTASNYSLVETEDGEAEVLSSVFDEDIRNRWRLTTRRPLLFRGTQFLGDNLRPRVNRSSLTETEDAAGTQLDFMRRESAVSQRERMKARFRMLKRLQQDHDSEGAAAPRQSTIDAGLSFLASLETAHSFTVTLNDEGCAVIEFEDQASGFFADLTFLADGKSVECYCRVGDAPSKMVTGALTENKVKHFLTEAMGVYA